MISLKFPAKTLAMLSFVELSIERRVDIIECAGRVQLLADKSPITLMEN